MDPEMLDVIMPDATHVHVPMSAVLQALGLDMQQQGNTITRRMHQYSPGQLVEVTTHLHPGAVRMDTLERWSA